MRRDCNPSSLFIQNQNQMVARVISANSKKRESELDDILKTETILGPDQAKDWGLVQEIRTEFYEPGAILVTVNTPAERPPKKANEFKTLPFLPVTTPTSTSGIAER
jgi:hypothetical protein